MSKLAVFHAFSRLAQHAGVRLDAPIINRARGLILQGFTGPSAVLVGATRGTAQHGRALGYPAPPLTGALAARRDVFGAFDGRVA